MRKKEGILCFLDVMIKYSDENHPLSVAKIMELLKEKHHIDVAKQTVYNYFEVLEAMNIEVVKGDKGRYLLSRTLEKEEAFLLCHSIIANNTIEEKYSQDMIQKIIGTQSTYFDSSFIHYIYNVDKKDNKDLFLNISLIGECIKTKCKISFNYTTYNFKKEIINKREKKYYVIPLCIVARDNRYYLLAKYENHDNILPFRLDKIINAKVSYPHNYENNINPYEYVKNRLYMHSGEIEQFTLLCDNKILDDVIDLFGKNIHIMPHNENQFVTIVKTTKQAIIYFALQYVNYVKVTSPDSLRLEIKKILEEAIKKY